MKMPRILSCIILLGELLLVTNNGLCDELMDTHSNAENIPAFVDYAVIGSKLVYYSEMNTNETFYIPDGVTEIGAAAFICNQYLKKVVFPEGVLIIQSGAFEQCRNLVEVFLPETLLYIGTGAFCGCCKLTTINLPSSLLVIGTSAFSETGEIEKIIIPESCEVVGNGAFAKSKVKEIYLLPWTDIYISPNITDPYYDTDIYLSWDESWFAEEIIDRYRGKNGHVYIIGDDQKFDLCE